MNEAMSTGAGCLAEMIALRKVQFPTLAILSIGLVCWSGTVATDTLTSPSESNASSEQSFAQPKVLAELLALSVDDLEKVDLGRMNLLCAEGLNGSDGLDVESCVSTLDAWARHVERETKRNFHQFASHPEQFNRSLPYYQMGMLGTVLAEDLQIQYNPERERQLLEHPIPLQTIEQEKSFFNSSKDVFIHGLLTGKHSGTCASMPFLYAAIGRRLGYPVTIAARKYHLYVRYEAGGAHLNIETTENRGFSTPTDDEYRNGPYPMTQAEIEANGWVRPLSNKEILGICLLNRANCLRSMKKHDAVIQTLADAARYLPDNPQMRQAIARNQDLERKLRAADRWDELWDEVESLRLPTAGPKCEHFQNSKLMVQLSMNQSTNLAEIEKFVTRFKEELQRYRNEISDSPTKLAEAFSPPPPSAYQRQFLALTQAEALTRRIRIPEERVPPEYWRELPPELEVRVRKLANERDVIEEMHIFAAEEINLRNLEARRASHPAPLPRPPSPPGQEPQLNIRLEDLALAWRGREIPPELKDQLVDLARLGSASERRMKMQSVINNFFLEEDQRNRARDIIRRRRSLLDLEPTRHPPVQIEIVPSPRRSEGSPTPPDTQNFPLTPMAERQINPVSTGDE